MLAALAEGALDDALDGSDGGGLIVIEEGEDLGAEECVVGEFGEAGGACVGRCVLYGVEELVDGFEAMGFLGWIGHGACSIGGGVRAVAGRAVRV